MKGALIIYYSRGGNTKKMAELIAAGIRKEGVEAALKDIKDVGANDLLKYDGLVIGSPTYYGSMSAEIKKLFDDSVRFHGKLDGKAGAAFSSSRNIAGGNETAILDILHAMLIHGMIIQGDWQGDHYGPAAIDAPDERSTKECLRMGSRFAQLLKKCIA
ncbi:MAG: flavodoxin family protein [Candidatus Omnitrophica bacterium]|nr:flavodoxin family protein [Candidatus Omnitrophota bacterium]MDD5027298.1 flavodoxin family protein [Candidatus Omnitrophota bacterium]MDD5662230.1 flavodoxin family protein [Candidatus Omnitrophota bacterium]